MAAYWIMAIIVAVILGTAFFMVGPQIIEAVVNKIDEWAEIIDAFKEEK